jgi:lipoprotein-anchoring transpeptidase ErfK/SrfK
VRTAVLIAGAAVLVAILAYCIGCVYFYQRFFPNTTLGGADVSLMGADDAKAALELSSQTRTVRVSGQGTSFSLTGARAGLELDVDAAVQTALANSASWQWPVQVFAAHDESDSVTASFDLDTLRAAVEGELASFNAMATEPTDAFLYYDEASSSYQINPGSLGTKLDVDSVVDTVLEVLTSSRGTSASLTSANLVQQTVTAGDEALVAARDAANVYLSCDIELTVGGTLAATLGPSTVRSWVSLNEDGTATLDETALATWVSTLESTIDSRGKTRTYTQPTTGKTVTVSGSGGTYGWVSNGAELLQLVRDAVYNGYTGTYEVPLKQSAAVYNPGGADWGLRYVDVDLTEQWIYFYDESGNLVYNTCIISGLVSDEEPTERATPTGVYVLNNKALDQTLIGLTDEETGEPEYETPVSYWMPFIGNAIGLHDADWQAWGSWSSTYYRYAGSHGCVNMPPSAAAWAYDWLRVGDVIITHY